MFKFYMNAIGSATYAQRADVLLALANCSTIGDTRYGILLTYAKGVWYVRNS